MRSIVSQETTSKSQLQNTPGHRAIDFSRVQGGWNSSNRPEPRKGTACFVVHVSRSASPAEKIRLTSHHGEGEG
jgi:hypothetical protein